MGLEQIGEFGLIKRIKKKVDVEAGRVHLGIDDDAAAFEPTKGMVTLLTTDTLVEGIHFDPAYATAYQIGWKAMAANLSDIAAMGGVPRTAVVSLCLPDDTEVEWVEELYVGMNELIGRFEGAIVGGDTSVARKDTVITITLTGEVEHKRMITRAGAQKGDIICVTGDLGSSVSGLKIIRKEKIGKEKTKERWSHVIEKHLLPHPRIHEARILVAETTVNAMIDISDGLASEIHHICELSKTGAKIYTEELPIHPQTMDVADECNGSAQQYVLYGGEDFELLFTLSPKNVGDIFDIIVNETGTKVSVIGAIAGAKEGIVLVNEQGDQQPLPFRGYNHFAKRWIRR